MEAQEEVQNQDSLSPSPSSPAIQLVTEDVVLTPIDVISGSAAIDQRVKDLVEDFRRFRSEWINSTAKEVRFLILLRLAISDVAHFDSKVVRERK